MTREKAIEVLENGAWWDLLIPITTIEGRKSDIELHEALDIAIAALYPSVGNRLRKCGKAVLGATTKEKARKLGVLSFRRPWFSVVVGDEVVWTNAEFCQCAENR